MAREDLKSKPEAVRAKIVEGRLDKIKRQYALLEQARCWVARRLARRRRSPPLPRQRLGPPSARPLPALYGPGTSCAPAEVPSRALALSTSSPSPPPPSSSPPKQPALRDNNKSVTEIIKETIAAVGENIQARGSRGSAARRRGGAPLGR
jgi:hypothetical protein